MKAGDIEAYIKRINLDGSYKTKSFEWQALHLVRFPDKIVVGSSQFLVVLCLNSSQVPAGVSEASFPETRFKENSIDESSANKSIVIQIGLLIAVVFLSFKFIIQWQIRWL